MESQVPRLHILFFPFMAHGHMIPTLDMAKLFAGRGAKSTIITTPLNVPLFEKTIERSRSSGLDIDIKIFDFPSAQLGLPEGCESLDFVISNLKPGPDNLLAKFFFSTKYLKDQLEDFIGETKADCLIADMFFPWATESADKFGVPRLVFHGTSAFALSALECIRLYEPHKKVESDSEPFIIPNLPGNITMTRKKMADSGSSGGDNDFAKMLQEVKESELKSFGVVVNSFYELEPAYADYFRNVLGRRTWHVGPVSLCNKGIQEKAERGGRKATIDEHECLKWLDSKRPNSVIYLSFGSMTSFNDAQLMEIAVGLERSGQDFIWVVRRENKKEDKEEWLPEGFEERMQGKGLIIRGWAPQILILDHKAIGGFVTHCGWNSVLEGVSAGLPMVAWPVSAEQFYNEKMVTEVLKTGVSVGVQRLVMLVGDFIERDKVEKAVRDVMEGKEAEERRSRAIELAELAKTAVANGGSSWSDMTNLMQELSMVRSKRDKKEEA